MSLHVERVGDEVLLTVRDDDNEDGESIVVSLSTPEGVNELIKILLEEQGDDNHPRE